VEVSSDAVEGLHQALEGDYAAVLLDVKMPKMDGIQFLELLRQKKANLPVLITTGYPNVSNAAAAIRLGASDYVTKPFTPQEITRAVERIVPPPKREIAPAPAAAEADRPPANGLLFYDGSWFRLENDGSTSVGAILAGLRGTAVTDIRLPRIGEAVYQGLPLAGLVLADKPLVIIRAPITGVVAAVNDGLNADPTLLLRDPCGKGWIACVCATRFEEEVNHCWSRCLILASSDTRAARQESQRLAALGCQVRIVADRETLGKALQEAGCSVLLLDAASFGAEGPTMVEQVNVQTPAVRVVVVASPEGPWEKAYRKHHIFYYAVSPFADDEIVDILDAAFRPPEPPPPRRAHAEGPAEWISSIQITNRNHHNVRLMAGPGLLRGDTGLGAQIEHRLVERMYPVSLTLGQTEISPPSLFKMVNSCDRLVVLLAKDSGQLPGSLVRETKAHLDTPAGEGARKFTTLSVQPDTLGGFAGLDTHTTAALAGHIVEEMASS
jgi:DNA-binding response OmpR family regulator/glycine cleavage system H lipoate-binding protein